MQGYITDREMAELVRASVRWYNERAVKKALAARDKPRRPVRGKFHSITNGGSSE